MRSFSFHGKSFEKINNMKNLSAFFLLIFFFVTFCYAQKKSQSNDPENMYLLIGTYTSGSSQGIYVYDFNISTGDFEYKSETQLSNPSYQAISSDEKFVYSISVVDKNNAASNAFTFDKKSGKLTFLNSEQTNSSGPCYINVDRNNKFVVTANYAGGNISVFPLSEKRDLLPTSQVIDLVTESDTQTTKQKKSHMHTAVFSPDNKYLYVTDLGKDKIYMFPINYESVDKKFLNQENMLSFDLEPGSGPRHMAFHPNHQYAYVINELSGKVTVLSYHDGILKPIQYIVADTTSYKKRRGSADIHLSPNGKFLYASNRLGADGIAIFEVNESTGLLTFIDYQSTGIHPRNFVITANGKLLLVANRDSNNIQIFKIEPHTGLLKDTGKEINIDKPVCLKFINK